LKSGLAANTLPSNGFTETVLVWTTSFVTGRTQQVLYNGCLSAVHPVQYGVPQGSVLGFILFVCHHHLTKTAMLRVLSDVLTAADAQQVTLLGLLDLSVAFDCFDHQLLLQRL